MAIIVTTPNGDFFDYDAEDWDIVAPNVVDLVDAVGERLSTYFDVVTVAHFLDEDDELDYEDEIPDNVIPFPATVKGGPWSIPNSGIFTIS